MDENENPNNDKPSDQPHKQPITKLKIGKAAATTFKWIGKGVGIAGAILKQVESPFTQLAGTAIEGVSDVIECKLSDKIAAAESDEQKS